jgi:hypothetical protein
VQDSIEEEPDEGHRTWFLNSMRSKGLALAFLYLGGMVAIMGVSAPGLAGLFTQSNQSNQSQVEYQILTTESDGVDIYQLWDRFFNLGRHQNAARIIQSRDGGYVIAGSVGLEGKGWDDACVIKLDDSGRLVWTHIFGGDGIEVASSIAETITGDLVVVGRYHPPPACSYSRILVYKLDGAGNLLWNISYGSERTTWDDRANDLAVIDDGSFIVVGVTEDAGDNNHLRMSRINDGGQLVWDRVVDGCTGGCIRAAPDGGFLIGGRGQGGLWVLKIDIQGEELWSRTYEHGGEAVSIIESGDGDFIVAGSSRYETQRKTDYYLMKVNSEGEMLWESRWDANQTWESATSVVPSDGGYYISGYGLPSMDSLIIRIDDEGREEWEMPVPYAVLSMTASKEGGLIAAGSGMNILSLYEGKPPIPEPIPETLPMRGIIPAIIIVVMFLILSFAYLKSIINPDDPEPEDGNSLSCRGRLVS